MPRIVRPSKNTSSLFHANLTPTEATPERALNRTLAELATISRTGTLAMHRIDRALTEPNTPIIGHIKALQGFINYNMGGGSNEKSALSSLVNNLTHKQYQTTPEIKTLMTETLGERGANAFYHYLNITSSSQINQNAQATSVADINDAQMLQTRAYIPS